MKYFNLKSIAPIFTIMLGMMFCSVSVAQEKSFPDEPLQTSADRPAANIMFILDDSGSMGWDYMPDGLSSAEWIRRNYLQNPLAYDPNRTYEPWRNWNGSVMTGGTNYNSVYSNASLASGSTNLSSTTVVFYGPTRPNVPFGSTTRSDFYRYTIARTSIFNSTLIIRRCEWTSGTNWNRNCVTGNAALPSNRSFEQERQNYAIWYSYHRTRMKISKAGITEAFSQLTGGIRVGYDSIWNRSSMRIPVSNNEGLFDGSNKQTWFNRVLAANANGGTPLHGSLRRAGEYFRETGSNGPWGPESGSTQFSCRQNFTILTSDGYWNNSSGYTGNQTVGNADGTPSITHTSSRGDEYTYSPRRPYSDSFSDTLADVAMHYWKTDLRPDLINNVQSSAGNPAFWQHMVTFGISIGLEGTLNPQEDLPAITNGSISWPDPWRARNGGPSSWNSESARRIDDLWHASVNGRGSFTAATNPDQFVKGLKSALGNIQRILASGSNVSTSSTSLQTDSRIFHATYYSGVWTGELAAYDISSAGVAQDPSWMATDHIRYNNRNMLTHNGSSGTTFPTSNQIDELEEGFGVDGVEGEDIANYLKGNRSMEALNGGPFRNRETLLGDIVNSSPIYSVDTDAIFIGTNGGTLHGFNGMTGEEYFAYAPGGIDYNALGTFADPEYAHRFFVDGQLAVSNQRQTPGFNYLVGALGRGGRGVFGLDVTNPSSFSASNVLWDKTQSNDSDMGYVIGEIIIAKTNGEDDVALVPNGIDSPSGRAVLYVIRLSDGEILRKIDTGVAGSNALSSPRGWDEDGDGLVDYVYAGDLRGNLWKFDMKSENPSEWRVAFQGQPLYRARDASGNEQPIMGGLALGLERFGNRRWVIFGTGKYIHQSDITSHSQQTVYGIVDDGLEPVTRNDLQERSIALVQQPGGGSALRAFETFEPLPSGRKGWRLDLGIPYAGERVIERGFLSGRVFTFPSVIPTSGNPCESSGRGFVNAIDAFTGTTVGHEGENHPYFDVGGDGNDDNDWIEGDPGDGSGETRLPVGSIETSVGMVTRPVLVGEQIVYGGSSGGRESERVNLPPASAKRLSWREYVD